jgi:hypothetical protein
MIVMLFADRIRRLKDEMQMLRWKFAATKDIDASPFSKIERSEHCAKHEQIIAIAKIFKVNRNDFLSFWLADRIIEVIEDEKELSKKALNVAQKQIKK